MKRVIEISKLLEVGFSNLSSLSSFLLFLLLFKCFLLVRKDLVYHLKFIKFIFYAAV